MALFHAGEQGEAEQLISDAIEQLRSQSSGRRALEHGILIYAGKEEADRFQIQLDELD